MMAPERYTLTWRERFMLWLCCLMAVSPIAYWIIKSIDDLSAVSARCSQ